MKTGTLYSASDKALFDALTQNSVTQSALRQLFLRRGIVVSHETPRDTLAKYFSRLVNDYNDFQMLARMFGTPNRRERTASFRVITQATLSNFEIAAANVIKRIQENGDSATYNIEKDGSIKISARYKKFHFEKNEFKQIVTKEAVITIEDDKGAIVIRGPQNSDVDDWCRLAISDVEAQLNGAVQIDEISLETITNPEKRSQFFSALIDSIHGFTRHDVTDVYIFNPKASQESDISTDALNGENSGGSTTIGIHISRASLRGERVLDSDEFRALTARGFYISKIIWQSKKGGTDSDIYEFEAQFTEPESCTQFSYLPRGFYKYLGNGDFAKHKTQFTNEEDRELNKLIEITARNTVLAISNPT